ncbi:MAG TPA: ceramidase domain-containing protein [Burkholderiales bacterium]|nr:ceramidase domain-containing protein [Burkholderiales bacterium]
MNGSPATLSSRELALVLLLLVPLGILFTAVPPIPQDPAYHLLADTRTCLGIPNFGNVFSNAAFLVIGFIGLRHCILHRVDGASRSWTLFFFGTLLVAFGSGYYHWSPDNVTLAWDRLPMTIAFMALFSALIAEHVRPDIERTLLRASIAIGILSVVWWRYTDDLRLYAWVQFGPMLVIVFLLFAYRGRYGHRVYLVWALAFYMLAKVAEFGDVAIYEITGNAISGHTLKHLLAAVAPYFVYVMLRERKAISA